MSASPPIYDDITIVIPTLGREILRRSLEAMAAGTVWPGQIVVVDQARRDEVRAMIEELRARGLDAVWVPSERKGRSAGLNDGIRRASTRFVAITDDDCVVEPEWLERMTDWLRREPDAIVNGRVEAGEGDVTLAVEVSREPSVQTRPNLLFDRMVGGNMGLAKSTYDRIGGFEEDPSMRTAEDVEYAYRALRAGVRIIYVPDIALEHLGWRDEGERLVQYDSYARSHGGFYGKYLRRGDLFIAARALTHLARSLRRWVLGTLRGRPEHARHGRAYSTGLLPGIAAGWRSEGRR